MGHKIDPRAYRLGVTGEWQSRYFKPKQLKASLEEDFLVREYLAKKLAKSGVEGVEIERSGDTVQVIIRSSRPGLIIGRGGTGIEDLKKAIEKVIIRFRKKDQLSPKFNLRLIIEEVRQPEISAQLVAENISIELEKRNPFRRVIKQTLSRIMQHKEVEGARIMVSGRLDGAEIARTERLSEGKIPLVTIRSNIDYGMARATCTYGVVGIKVWIYKGEKLKDSSKER